MTTRFDRPLVGFRFAETHHGDSLQTIAARELGDANRWVELIHLNNLLPPFLVNDPALAAPGVLLAGQQILLPSAALSTNISTDPEAVFESDVQMGVLGELLTDGTDFVVASGRDNLKQALQNRIRTDRGELIFHPRYGCGARRLVGKVNGPTAGLLAAQEVKASLPQDPRVQRVTKSVAVITGDVVSVSADVETVLGRPVSAQVSLS